MTRDYNEKDEHGGVESEEFDLDYSESSHSRSGNAPIEPLSQDSSSPQADDLVPFPRKNPEALSIDSPPPSDDEDENEEVRPLRRILTGRRSSQSERARSSSYASGHRNSTASTTRRTGQRKGSTTASSNMVNEEDEEEDLAEDIERRDSLGLKRMRSARAVSQSALLEKYLEQIEEAEEVKDTDPSFASGVYETLLQAVKQIIKPEFFRYDYPSLKIAFRTWACGWVGLLLMVIPPVERWLGPASFLLILIGLLALPGGLSVTHATVNILLLAAFPAWGLLCAYIANLMQWAVRGYPTKEGIMAELAAEGICKMGDAACLQEAVLTGRYLRIDVSIITIFQIVVSMWVPGLAEQYHKPVFRTPFVMNLLMVFPIIPSQNATPYLAFHELYRDSINAIYLAYALNLLSCYLIFPVTSNWKYVNALTTVAKGTKDQAESFFTKANKELPSSDTFEETFKGVPAKCSKLSSHFFKIDMDGLMLKLEISYSRLDTGDIGEFRSRLREVLTALSSIHFFLINIQNCKEILKDAAKRGTYEKYTQGAECQDELLKKAHLHDIFTPIKERHQGHAHYKPTGRFESRRENWRTLERRDFDDLKLEDLDEFYKLIMTHYDPALVSATKVVDQVSQWLAAANSYRLRSMLPHLREKYAQMQQERSEALSEAIKELEVCHAELVKGFPAYRNKVEDITEKGTAPYLFILSQDSFLNFVTNEFLNRVHRLARYCGHLDHAHPKPRWLYPFGTTRAKSLGIALFHMGSSATDQVEIGDFIPVHQVETRNPDASPPRTGFHFFALRVENVMHWFTSPLVSFNTKRSFAVVIPFIIFFVRQTLQFGFKCHTIWVSIIFMLTCARQAVDGAYGFVTRLYATFLGCMLGMVMWYISSGSGNGNSYGLAVVSAFGFVIIAMHRHFNKDKVPLGSIVFCITNVLVIGDSWATGYAPQIGVDVGRGWKVAYLRFVTVVIAVSFAFVVTMFPVPSTGKQAIREGLGFNQKELGETMCSIVNFALQRLDDPQVHVKRRSDPIRTSFKLITNQLLTASRIASLMKFEPAFTGVWPEKRYKFLISMQQEIASLQSLTLLLFNKVEYSSDLIQLMDEMGVADIELLSSTYAVFYMTANALLTKKALPSITPGGLSLRHWKHFTQLRSRDKEAESFMEAASDMYTTYDGRLRLAGLTVSNLLYDSIDGSMLIVKGLVGESFGTDERIYFLNSSLRATYLG